jgi:hypothetical protein
MYKGQPMSLLKISLRTHRNVLVLFCSGKSGIITEFGHEPRLISGNHLDLGEKTLYTFIGYFLGDLGWH